MGREKVEPSDMPMEQGGRGMAKTGMFSLFTGGLFARGYPCARCVDFHDLNYLGSRALCVDSARRRRARETVIV